RDRPARFRRRTLPVRAHVRVTMRRVTERSPVMVNADRCAAVPRQMQVKLAAQQGEDGEREADDETDEIEIGPAHFASLMATFARGDGATSARTRAESPGDSRTAPSKRMAPRVSFCPAMRVSASLTGRSVLKRSAS